jgi:hypothetical protein
MIPDAHSRAIGIGRGEHGEEWLDFSAIGGELEMAQALRVDFGGIAEVPEVADLEGLPEETADATRVIAPGCAGAVLEFLEGGRPCATLGEFGFDGAETGLQAHRLPLFFRSGGTKKVLGLVVAVGGGHHSMTELA